jgi:hypothetical protein
MVDLTPIVSGVVQTLIVAAITAAISAGVAYLKKNACC